MKTTIKTGQAATTVLTEETTRTHNRQTVRESPLDFSNVSRVEDHVNGYKALYGFISMWTVEKQGFINVLFKYF